MKKGFTLIELLIVIGILAILATVVVVVLNPAQLFAQARDSQRVSDMTTLRSALSLYLATVGAPDLGACASLDSPVGVRRIGIFTFQPSTTSIVQVTDTSLFYGGASTYATSTWSTTSSVRTVAGSGWVDVDFTDVPGGSPLSTLPIDPTNNDTYFYGYTCNDAARTFKFISNMESTRYASSGSDDVESKDGGRRLGMYEVGTDMDL